MHSSWRSAPVQEKGEVELMQDRETANKKSAPPQKGASGIRPTDQAALTSIFRGRCDAFLGSTTISSPLLISALMPSVSISLPSVKRR